MARLTRGNHFGSPIGIEIWSDGDNAQRLGVLRLPKSIRQVNGDTFVLQEVIRQDASGKITISQSHQAVVTERSVTLERGRFDELGLDEIHMSGIAPRGAVLDIDIPSGSCTFRWQVLVVDLPGFEHLFELDTFLLEQTPAPDEELPL